jgi:hypothetical protein
VRRAAAGRAAISGTYSWSLNDTPGIDADLNPGYSIGQVGVERVKTLPFRRFDRRDGENLKLQIMPYPAPTGNDPWDQNGGASSSTVMDLHWAGRGRIDSGLIVIR